jgi:hypothetical protein
MEKSILSVSALALIVSGVACGADLSEVGSNPPTIAGAFTHKFVNTFNSHLFLGRDGSRNQSATINSQVTNRDPRVVLDKRRYGTIKILVKGNNAFTNQVVNRLSYGVEPRSFGGYFMDTVQVGVFNAKINHNEAGSLSKQVFGGISGLILVIATWNG